MKETMSPASVWKTYWSSQCPDAVSVRRSAHVFDGLRTTSTGVPLNCSSQRPRMGALCDKMPAYSMMLTSSPWFHPARPRSTLKPWPKRSSRKMLRKMEWSVGRGNVSWWSSPMSFSALRRTRSAPVAAEGSTRMNFTLGTSQGILNLVDLLLRRRIDRGMFPRQILTLPNERGDSFLWKRNRQLGQV